MACPNGQMGRWSKVYVTAYGPAKQKPDTRALCCKNTHFHSSPILLSSCQGCSKVSDANEAHSHLTLLFLLLHVAQDVSSSSLVALL